MNRGFLFVILGSMLLVACGLAFRRNPASIMPMGRNWWGGSYPTNGENIYFTATNDRGERIPYSGGPAFGGGMMMSASLSCASCHGDDGRGGVHTMHMQVMDAPDIRYITLSSEEDEHSEDEHADEHGAYDLDAFRQAVVYGQHPNGDPLDRDMPRWRMSDQDLADLFELLKTLP